MTQLEKIEKEAHALSLHEAALDHEMAEIANDVAEVYSHRKSTVKALIRCVTERRSTLHTLIQENPGLFEKPKTLELSGYKVGYRKGTGAVEYEDAEEVIRLIRKHLPDQAKELIKTKETPIVSAMKELEVGQAKKIGITIEESGDIVVIKRLDSAVEKITKALLKDAADRLED